jgi:hypothetical protein
LYKRAFRTRRWVRISSNADDVPVVIASRLNKPAVALVFGSLLSKSNACFIFAVSLGWNHCFGIIERRTQTHEHNIADIANEEYLISKKWWSMTKIRDKYYLSENTMIYISELAWDGME